MKRLGIILGMIAAILPFVFKTKRIVDIRLAGSGPDVVYNVLFEGKKVANIRKDEEIRLALTGKGKAVEIAIGDIVIRSSDLKPKIVFNLPPLQNPKVEYTFESSDVVIKSVTDDGPYPVNWKVDGSNDFPMKIPLPATPILEGFIEKKKVYSEKMTLSKISSVTYIYDGNHLEIHPVLTGFFKTNLFSINDLEISSPISIKALALPKEISLEPIYGKMKFDGIIFKVPQIPDFEKIGNTIRITKTGFFLNDSPASGNLELPNGTSLLKWIYESGSVRFERIWNFYIDRDPPIIDVNLERSNGALVLNLKSNEWSSFVVKCGPVLMSGEGTEVSFRIRKILGNTIYIIATDKSGNTTKKEINLKEVKE